MTGPRYGYEQREDPQVGGTLASDPPPRVSAPRSADVRSVGQAAKKDVGQIVTVPGIDPALRPLGTELSQFSSEFDSVDSVRLWTWLNQGTSTVTIQRSRAVLVPQAGGAGVNNLRLWGPPTWPAAPWTARIRFLDWSWIADQGGGVAVYRALNGRLHTPNISRRVTNQLFTEVWAVNDWSSVTALNATRFGPQVNDSRADDRFFQLRCDGTSLFFDVSVDNEEFAPVTSTPLATYLGGTGTDLRVLLIANDPTTGLTPAKIGYDWLRVYGDAALNR